MPSASGTRSLPRSSSDCPPFFFCEPFFRGEYAPPRSTRSLEGRHCWVPFARTRNQAVATYLPSLSLASSLDSSLWFGHLHYHCLLFSSDYILFIAPTQVCAVLADAASHQSLCVVALPTTTYSHLATNNNILTQPRQQLRGPPCTQLACYSHIINLPPPSPLCGAVLLCSGP